MTVALSIVTPIITSGLGPAAPYGVNALNFFGSNKMYSKCVTVYDAAMHSLRTVRPGLAR